MIIGVFDLYKTDTQIENGHFVRLSVYRHNKISVFCKKRAPLVVLR